MSFITCGELARISIFLSAPRALTPVVRDNVPNNRNIWNNLCLLVVRALKVLRSTKKVWSMADEMVHALLEVRIQVVVSYHAQIERAHSRSSVNEKATATERYYHMCSTHSAIKQLHDTSEWREWPGGDEV